MRSLSTLTIASMAALALGSLAAHAQSGSSVQCGIESWSTEKMTYVSLPCGDGPEGNARKAVAEEPVAVGPAAYCAALVQRYDRLLARDSRLGGPSLSLETRAGAEKCRAGDASGIAPLEKALRDARIDLPRHS